MCACVRLIVQTEGIDLPLPSFKAAVKILHRSNRRSFLQSSTSSDDMFTDSGRFKSVRRTSTRISMALDSGGANVESPPTLPKRAKMKFVRQMSQGYSLQIEEIEEELPEDIILKMVRKHLYIIHLYVCTVEPQYMTVRKPQAGVVWANAKRLKIKALC